VSLTAAGRLFHARDAATGNETFRWFGLVTRYTKNKQEKTQKREGKTKQKTSPVTLS